MFSFTSGLRRKIDSDHQEKKAKGTEENSTASKPGKGKGAVDKRGSAKVRMGNTFTELHPA